MRCLLVTFFVALAMSASAWAEVGDLDPFFGTDGRASALFAGPGGYVMDIAVQSDGKIVAAGCDFKSPGVRNCDFAMVRFERNGQRDLSFGQGGVVSTPINQDYDHAHAIAIQPDGKIILAGITDTDPVPSDGYEYGKWWDMALIRYNSDGSLDTSFGVGGIVTTDVMDSDMLTDVALQPDGKIVAIGTANDVIFANNRYQNINTSGVVLRYNEDGTLDQTFGSSGRVQTHRGVRLYFQAGALQPDGKIVAAGALQDVGTGTDFATVRYTPDGSLDPTFGDGGISVTPVERGQSSACRTPYDFAYALALQPDGKIVLGGTGSTPRCNSGSNTSFAMVRLNPDGTLDKGFNGDGIMAETAYDGCIVGNCFGDTEHIRTLAVLPDGKILAGGVSETTPYPPYQAVGVLMRLNENGRPDATFGGGGRLVSFDGELIAALAIEGDGNVVAARTVYGARESQSASHIVRYLGDPRCNEEPRSDCASSGDAATILVSASPDGTRKRARMSWKAGLDAAVSGGARASRSAAICVYDAIEGAVLANGRLGHTAKSIKLKSPKARGVHLGRALEFPVRAQVNTIDGRCWETTFGLADAVINDGAVFKAVRAK